MVVILTGLLVAVTVASVFLTSGFSFIDTMLTTSDVSRNTTQMERVVTSLRSAGAISNDGLGRIVMPKPDTGGSYPTLPSGFTGVSETPWGVPYQYCPFSGPNNGLGTTISVPGGSYDVNYAQVGGRKYVSDSEDHPNLSGNVIGVLVATAPNVSKANMPSCLDVTKSGGSYTVSDGIVRVVTASSSMLVDAVEARGTFVVHAAPTSQGRGDGSSPANAVALETALSRFYGSRPGVMRIELADGTYNLTNTQLGSGATARYDGATLELVGSGAGNVTLNCGSGCPFTWMPKANLVVEGVTIGPDIRIETVGRKLIADAATLPATSVDQGRFLSRNAVTVASNLSAYALDLAGDASMQIGGDLTLDLKSTATTGIRANEALVDLSGSSSRTVSVTNGSGSTTSVSAKASRVVVNGVTASLSPSGHQYGFDLEDSTLRIENGASVSFGNAPLDAVYADNSDVRVAGGSSLAVTATTTGDDGLDLRAGSTLVIGSGSKIGTSGNAPDFGIRASGYISMIRDKGGEVNAGSACFVNRAGAPDVFTGPSDATPPNQRAELKNAAASLACNP